MDRTDKLAAKIGIGVKGLPQIMGISQGTFFTCRKGNCDISAKTWLKLESAERAAGIGVAEPEPPPVAEPEASDLDARLARMEEALERLTQAVERLACAGETRPTSSAARGAERKKSA